MHAFHRQVYVDMHLNHGTHLLWTSTACAGMRTSWHHICLAFGITFTRDAPGEGAKGKHVNGGGRADHGLHNLGRHVVPRCPDTHIITRSLVVG